MTCTENCDCDTKVKCCRRSSNNVPGTVHGRDSVGVSTGMVEKFDQVVTGDDTGRYNITKRSHVDIVYFKN